MLAFSFSGMRAVWTLVCLSVLLVHVGAVTIKLLDDHEISDAAGSRALWHPRGLTRITDAVVCFVTADRACPDCPPITLCSSDRGRHFTEALNEQPHCLLRGGMAVNDTLLCPGDSIVSDKGGNNIFSTDLMRFVPQGGKLTRVQGENMRMTLRLTGLEKLASVHFNGAVLALPTAVRHTRYLVPVSVTFASGARAAYMLHSADGVSWHKPAKLPFDTAQTSTLYSRGEERLVVVSVLDNNTIAMATSGYLGRYWSSPKPLPTTAMPAVASYPRSGVRVEYGLHNTSHVLTIVGGNTSSSEGSSTKIALPHVADGDVPYVTLCDVSAMPDKTSPRALMAVYDGGVDGASSVIRVAVYELDDSNEVEAKERLREKLRKEAEERAEVTARLQKEAQARTRRERKERRRKELAQWRAFRGEDAANVQRAKDNMQIDGEFIVVRKVGKHGAKHERHAFFDGL